MRWSTRLRECRHLLMNPILWRRAVSPQVVRTTRVRDSQHFVLHRIPDISGPRQLGAWRLQIVVCVHLCGADPLVVSPLKGVEYCPLFRTELGVLFELIAERYERRSILITANQPFSGWTDVFPDPGMTVAAIDRLVHHSTIFELHNVESDRGKVAECNQQT